MPETFVEFACPWCGEPNQVECEPGDAGQRLTQDCRVCCNPIELRLPGPGNPGLVIERE